MLHSGEASRPTQARNLKPPGSPVCPQAASAHSPARPEASANHAASEVESWEGRSAISPASGATAASDRAMLADTSTAERVAAPCHSTSRDASTSPARTTLSAGNGMRVAPGRGKRASAAHATAEAPCERARAATGERGPSCAMPPRAARITSHPARAQAPPG